MKKQQPIPGTEYEVIEDPVGKNAMNTTPIGTVVKLSSCMGNTYFFTFIDEMGTLRTRIFPLSCVKQIKND